MLHLDNVQAGSNINCSFPATDSASCFTPLYIKTVFVINGEAVPLDYSATEHTHNLRRAFSTPAMSSTP